MDSTSSLCLDVTHGLTKLADLSHMMSGAVTVTSVTENSITVQFAHQNTVKKKLRKMMILSLILCGCEILVLSLGGDCTKSR